MRIDDADGEAIYDGMIPEYRLDELKLLKQRIVEMSKLPPAGE